jgi:hypothetical protein
MTVGFLSMLLLLIVMQSSGGVSWFLNIFLCTLLGFFSYNCLYSDMVFSIHSCVCFVVIVRAWLFTVLAIVASVISHFCCRFSWFGRGGMLACFWFLSSSIIGCVCHCVMCFAI